MKRYGIFLIPVLLSACQPAEKSETKEFVSKKISIIAPTEKKPSQVITKNKKTKPVITNTRNFISDKHKNIFSLQNFYDEIALAPQTFIINSEKDTFITGEKGTLIYIPAYCFQKKNSILPCKENITFQLKECYDYPDMIAENLSTTSNGQPLESAGMICTTAISGTDTLELRKGQEISIAFNEVKENTIYDLYYGERDKQQNINWNIDLLGCTSTPIFKLVKGRYQNLYNDFFLNNFRLSKEDMIQLKEKTIGCNLSFSDAGEVIGYTFFDDNSEIKKNALKEFVELMKNYKEYDENLNFTGWGTQFYFMSSDRTKEYYSELEKSINPLVESKLYQARYLGWTNCDRTPIFKPIGNLVNFVNKKLNEIENNQILKHSKDLVINAGEINEKTDIKILYKNMRSILKPEIIGNTYVFKGIPDGQEVYILAIKCVEDQIYLTQEKIKIKDNMSPVSLNYKVYTDIKKVKKEINELTYL